MIKGTGLRKITSTEVNSRQAVNISLSTCKLIDDVRLGCYTPECSPLEMLRQRNVTPSENVALGDMTSSMVFIIHIHSLMDMSHICKRKGWFSPLSMQNIIFQHKMVLDDFFTSKGSIQVRKMQKQNKLQPVR